MTFPADLGHTVFSIATGGETLRILGCDDPALASDPGNPVLAEWAIGNLTKMDNIDHRACYVGNTVWTLHFSAIGSADLQPLPVLPSVRPQLVPVIGSMELPGPTSLDPVPFTLEFNRHIDASTLNPSDIVVSSGTVQDLRWMMRDNGTFGESGTGPGQLDDPLGLAVNGTGHIFVADHDNDRINVYNSTRDYFGSISSPGAFQGKFGSVHGLAVNGTGHLFRGRDRRQPRPGL